MTDRAKWLKELAEAKKNARFLTLQEDSPPPWDRERCVICEKMTLSWLQPENAPLCEEECMRLYIKNPTVYDPRELYNKAQHLVLVKPVPELAPKPAPVLKPTPEPAPKRKKRLSGRWEPSEKDIREMQERVAKRKRKPKSDV